MKMIYSEPQINAIVNRALADVLALPPSSDRQIRLGLTSLLPENIVDTMEDDFRADLNEMGRCYQCSERYDVPLWTSASLMAFRVFEDSVRTMACEDLGLNAEKMPLIKVIDKLEKIFTGEFVTFLQGLRELRNAGMHSVRRFARKSSVENVRVALWIAVFTHCVETDK